MITNLENIFFILMTASLAIELVTMYMIFDHLCDLFDKKFKVHLEKMTVGWDSLIPRMPRAAWYAARVAGFSKDRLSIQNAIGFDFRSKVSKRLYWLCVAHTLSLYALFMGMCIFGVCQGIQYLIKHFAYLKYFF